MSGNHNIKSLFMAMFILAACSDPQNSNSDVKITSMRGKAYTAEISGINVIYNPTDSFKTDGMSEEQLRESLASNPTMLNEMDNVAAWMSASLMIGVMRLNNGSSFTVQDIVIANRRQLEAFQVSFEYSATLQIVAKDGEIPQLGAKEFLVMRNQTKQAKEAFYQGNKGCFTSEVDHLRVSLPEDFMNMMFYYFNPELPQCDAKNFGDQIQKLSVQFKLSEENPATPKYPEYQEVWRDRQLTAAFMFTPVSDFTNQDDGGRNYVNMIKLLINRFGQPKSSTIDASLLGQTPTPAEHPESKITFDLADGRTLTFNMLYYSWGNQDDSKTQQKIADYSAVADFISYNGHAGYGMNIEKFEQLIQPKDNHYQMFFANGCSTFGYLGRAFFKNTLTPATTTTTATPAKKNVDLISNLTSTYFSQMPATNMAFIDALIEGKQSYLEILQKIEQLVPEEDNSHVVIRGEDDNLFIPGK